jgi:uncharacterized Zn finger protein
MNWSITIKCNNCGSEDLKPSLIPENEEIAINCPHCGCQELYDYDLDYDEFNIEG